jgi:hypothetical protein
MGGERKRHERGNPVENSKKEGLLARFELTQNHIES